MSVGVGVPEQQPEKMRPLGRAFEKAREAQDILRGVQEDLTTLIEYVGGPQPPVEEAPKAELPPPPLGAFDVLMTLLYANAEQALTIRQGLAVLAEQL